MNRAIKSSIWGLAVVLLAAVPGWAAAQTKIGYVNYGQLLEQSPQAQAIAEAIRNEFAPRQRELQQQQQQLQTREQQLQKDAATMTPDQRSRAEKELRDSLRDFQRKQGEVQDDFNARRNEEISRLQRTLIEQVQAYAKAQNFDLVIADGVIYANQAVDITPAILSQLQSQAKTTGTGAASRPAGQGQQQSQQPRPQQGR